MPLVSFSSSHLENTSCSFRGITDRKEALVTPHPSGAVSTSAEAMSGTWSHSQTLNRKVITKNYQSVPQGQEGQRCFKVIRS